MAQHRYTGPHPVPDEDGELVHPGDVREFEADPAWGPWELIEEEADGAAGSGPAPAAEADTGSTAPAAAAVPVPVSPAPVSTFSAPPVTPEGM
jgi:hypothetical protein